MNKDKILTFLVVIGLILFGVLFYKLILEIINVSLHLASWFLTFVNILVTILGICTGIILFVLLLAGILWSIEQLSKKIATYFSDLNTKVGELLRNKPQKILPLFIAVISQTFILLLSKDFTTNDTKKILSLILYIVLAIILITTSRQTKKIWGGLSIVLITALTTWLILARHNINNWELFVAYFQVKWQYLMTMPTIDMLSIGLISLSFLILIVLSLYYSFKKV